MKSEKPDRREDRRHCLGDYSGLQQDRSPVVTVGGLVFSGIADRYFRALGAGTGENLWKFRTNSGLVGQPVTYTIDGKQYLAIWSGFGSVNARGGAALVPKMSAIPEGGVLWIVILPEDWYNVP